MNKNYVLIYIEYIKTVFYSNKQETHGNAQPVKFLQWEIEFLNAIYVSSFEWNLKAYTFKFKQQIKIYE